MKAVYTGDYGKSNARFYKGYTFIKGEACDVDDAWFELNKGDKVKEAKTTTKRKAKTTTKRKVDGDNND